MVSVFKKFKAMVWKSLLLRKRNWILSVFDLFFPIGIMYLSWVAIKAMGLNQRSPPKSTRTADILSSPLTALDIVYSPSNSYCDKIMTRFSDSMNKEINMKLKTFQSENPMTNLRCKVEPRNNEKEVDLWLTEKTTMPKADGNSVVGVTFLDYNVKQKTFVYKIKSLGKINPNKAIKNYHESTVFTTIQHLLDYEILKDLGVNVEKLDVHFEPLQSNNEAIDKATLLFMVIYFFIFIAYVFLVVSTMRDIVQEKCTGIKELMRIMGVPTWMIWGSWYVYSLIIHIPVTLVITYIISIYEPVIIHGSIVSVWLLLFMYTTTSIVFLFVFTCCFSNATKAITVTVILYIVLDFLAWYKCQSIFKDFSAGLQILFCLIPTVNLSVALTTLNSFFHNGIEWNLEYLFSSGDSGSKISVGVSIVLFTLETLLLILILSYLDSVFPGPYGIAKPLNFVCMWFKRNDKNKNTTQQLITVSMAGKNFEEPPKDIGIGILVRGLCKKYGYLKSVLAVDNLDLNIYKGEIMALLGHNGAGKTTTMSMITGMFSPTSGVILVDGYDIRYNLSRFRESLGLCTQHNLYFPKLTVLEHLKFFGMLKGMSSSEAKLNGNAILDFLGMSEKINSMGGSLSGGMKRRLCLAVSLIGDPKILILDEPTSGLDPENRRKIWDIILSVRTNRTILITTHFMEEADVLGDRIAIMHQGKVVCCGTSMFLKKLYGVGYCIHIQKKIKSKDVNIRNLVERHVSITTMNIVSESQLDFVIKQDYVDRFPSLFSNLEVEADNVGITGVSISSTTMEDVFLNVANLSTVTGQELTERASKKSSQSLREPEILEEMELVKGTQLLYQRFKALVFKRLIYRKRGVFFFLIKSAVTILLVYLIVYVSTITIKPEKGNVQSSQTLSLSLYPRPIISIIYDKYNEIFAKTTMNLIHLHKGMVKALKSYKNISEYSKYMMTNYINDYKTNSLLGFTFIKNKYLIEYQPREKNYIFPIAVNIMSNVLLRNFTGDQTSSITVINHPFMLPYKMNNGCENEMHSKVLTEIFMTIFWGVIYFLVFSLLLAENILFVMEEKICGFKRQQIIAGVSPFLYWLSNFIFDFLVYLLLVLIHIIIIFLFGDQIFVPESSMFSTLVLVFLLLGLSGIPFSYVHTHLLNSISLNVALFWFQSIVFGLVLPLVVMYLKYFQYQYFMITVIACGFNPIFSSVICIITIVKNIVTENYCLRCKELCGKSIYTIPTKDDKEGIMLYLIMLCFTFLFYSFVLLVLDFKVFNKYICRHNNSKIALPDDLDKDVKDEANRVKHFKESSMVTSLRVDSLTKKYLFGPVAVNKVSFLVKKRECFGLLGVNGAGKTTTFKMLTGEIIPDSGDAFVNELSVVRNTNKYLRSVGYCPQFDEILDKLTGEELLRIIAQIRGIPSGEVKEEVISWLDHVGILMHANKRSGAYSGGTKRKLSTAMAFIGDPEVVFLDEPTTGVDPASRRQLWSVVKSRQKAGQAVVLTSHSMEECEALCTRLTIMVGGIMKCIGSVEYLKTRFGQGNSVMIKLIGPTNITINQFKTEFNSIFHNATIKDEHQTMIQYQIVDPSIPLSKIFYEMLRLKNKHNIVEDFSVNSTTLEELFLSFARNKYL